MTDLFLSDITGEKVNSRSYYIQNHLKNNKLHILIDIANGHQNNLHNLIKSLKTKYPENLVMMVGNIANPKTYELLSELGVWGIRCTIGNGSGCWTKGTKIKTIGGDKFIEDVNTDDKVLTHTGEYKDVIMTQSLKYNDDLIEINNNVSTKDHKYYIIDIIDKDKITDNNIHEYAKWVEAEFLDEEKHLLIEMVKND
ncbi:MAG: IMP dehydrogenase, partial [Candidatus Muirbacterium halophilum]|nr:IMP dehydrogenase [Candidatus Muirbacterium halophilum]